MSGIKNCNSVPKLFYNAEETKSPEISSVKGSIPSYVRGEFIRVGPGLWDLPEGSMNHFVDGYAIILKFSLDGQNVTFEKKFLESDAYKRAIAAKKPVVNEFGTKAYSDTSKSLISRVVSSLIPEISDNNYSTPFQFKSELFLSAESGALRSVDLHSLASNERHDAKKCFGCESFIAHPLRDENGDLYTIATSLSVTALKLNVIKISGNKSKTAKECIKKGKVFCTLPTRRNGAGGPPHSFGMTKNYLIVAIQPNYVTLSKVLSSLVKGTTVLDWFEWHPEDKCVFYIIEKSSGKILKTEYITEDAFYFMHFCNTYEEDDQIVVDINIYNTPAVIDTLNLNKLREGNAELEDQPYTCRFVLPLINDPTKTVEENVNLVTMKSDSRAIRRRDTIFLTPEIITQIPGGELPSLNPKFTGKKYSYFYMAGTYNPSHYSHSILKVNVDKKEVKVWKENEYNYPSEPIFIPNPNGIDEDDGILISTVTDSRIDSMDFLLYLNAKTMEDIGRAYFKNRIPTGLHGIYIPGK